MSAVVKVKDAALQEAEALMEPVSSVEDDIIADGLKRAAEETDARWLAHLACSWYPTTPNPWPNGVSVEWVWGKGWLPCFDVDAFELLSAYHAGRTAARALTLGEFGADLALALGGAL